MNSNDLNANISNKIRQLKLSSALLSKQLFAGNFLSICGGQGLDFDKLREYQIGDDLKAIDWKTTAKINKPFVKINREERQHHILFLIDISKSIEFGISNNSNKFLKNKKDIIAELCFTFAYSSIKNNDKIGAIFFSDEVEKIIPLSNSSNNTALIVNNLYNFEATKSGTNFQKVIQFLNSAYKKNTIIFIFSDFFCDLNFEKELAISAKKFKIIAFKINNSDEENLENEIGLLKIINKESGTVDFIDVSAQSNIIQKAKKEQIKLQKIMKKNNIPIIEISTNENYFKKLKVFFENSNRKLSNH